MKSQHPAESRASTALSFFRVICLDDGKFAAQASPGESLSIEGRVLLTIAPDQSACLLELTGEAKVEVEGQAIVDVAPIRPGDSFAIDGRRYVVLAPFSAFLADARSPLAKAAALARHASGHESLLVAEDGLSVAETSNTVTRRAHMPRRGLVIATGLVALLAVASLFLPDEGSPASLQDNPPNAAPLTAKDPFALAPMPTPGPAAAQAEAPEAPKIDTATSAAPSVVAAQAAEPAPALSSPRAAAPTKARQKPSKVSPPAPRLDPKLAAELAKKEQYLTELMLEARFDPEGVARKIQVLQNGVPAGTPLYGKLKKSLQSLRTP